MSQTNGQYLMTLHNRLNEHFSFQEMRTFSFYLGVDHESVAGDTKPAWIRELLIKLAQKGRLQELVTLAQKEFPQGNFPNVPPDFALPASLAVPAAAVAQMLMPLGRDALTF